MYGHEDVRGVDPHGEDGEEDGVEDGFLPGLQDVDAGDEQVLVVKPGQVLPKVLEVHLCRLEEEDGVKKGKRERGEGEKERQSLRKCNKRL